MSAGEDYRQALAGWLGSPENPVLARHLANVVWAHFLGIGIVEPVDDVRVSNPPSNPQLLDELGRRLVKYGFEIKPLVRDICSSRTYQLATGRNESNALDDRNFSHGRMRRIRAEVLLDCLSQVTETQDRFPGLRPGSRAVHARRWPHAELLSDDLRTSHSPDALHLRGRRPPRHLSQALHLINGETTSGKIEEGRVVERLLAERQQPMAVVADLYERCLSRRPTEHEAAVIEEDSPRRPMSRPRWWTCSGPYSIPTNSFSIIERRWKFDPFSYFKVRLWSSVLACSGIHLQRRPPWAEPDKSDSAPEHPAPRSRAVSFEQVQSVFKNTASHVTATTRERGGS